MPTPEENVLHAFKGREINIPNGNGHALVGKIDFVRDEEDGFFYLQVFDAEVVSIEEVPGDNVVIDFADDEAARNDGLDPHVEPAAEAGP